MNFKLLRAFVCKDEGAKIKTLIIPFLTFGLLILSGTGLYAMANPWFPYWQFFCFMGYGLILVGLLLWSCRLSKRTYQLPEKEKQWFG